MLRSVSRTGFDVSTVNGQTLWTSWVVHWSCLWCIHLAVFLGQAAFPLRPPAGQLSGLERRRSPAKRVVPRLGGHSAGVVQRDCVDQLVHPVLAIFQADHLRRNRVRTCDPVPSQLAAAPASPRSRPTMHRLWVRTPPPTCTQLGRLEVQAARAARRAGPVHARGRSDTGVRQPNGLARVREQRRNAQKHHRLESRATRAGPPPAARVGHRQHAAVVVVARPGVLCLASLLGGTTERRRRVRFDGAQFSPTAATLERV